MVTRSLRRATLASLTAVAGLLSGCGGPRVAECPASPVPAAAPVAAPSTAAPSTACGPAPARVTLDSTPLVECASAFRASSGESGRFVVDGALWRVWLPGL